jgi:metallo-beta-lactamase class B
MVQWFKNNYFFEEIIVIITHYHDDNLGGLNWFHQNGYDSFSISKTQEICKEKKIIIPRNIINNHHKFNFKEFPIEVHFLGQGHTVDSVCVYLPEQKILFGGCSVKAQSNSSLGNISDASLSQWPHTLEKMKSTFPEVQILIPGHGSEGTLSLIDHTLSLFSVKQ